jgi:hypothetical protein
VANSGANNVPNNVSVLLNNGYWISLEVTATDPGTGAAIGSITAGQSCNFTVTANAPAGNVLTSYAGTVQFTNGDPQATIIDTATGKPVPLGGFSYTFTAADQGTHTFRVDLKTAGTQSISVSDTAAGVTAGDAGITVNPAALRVLAVTGFPSPVAQEDTESFTVTAEDPFGNTVASYNGTIHFTSSDSQAILPADATLTNGTGCISATLETVGTQSITATDTTTPSLTGSQNDLQVVPLSFKVSFLSSVSAGVGEDFQVWAVDPYGNSASGYSGTVQITSSDSQAVIQPVYANLSGGYSEFSVTLNTVGYQSITATDTVHTSFTGSQTGIRVVPRASVNGPSAGMPNQTLTYTLGASGDPPGTVFTYQIDWNTGGSVVVEQTVTGTSGITVTHAFSTAGNDAVFVRIIDPNGFIGAWTGQPIDIVPVSVAIQTDPANTSRQMLVINGSASNDSIVLGAGAHNGVTLSVDGLALGNILPTNGNPFALVVVNDQGSNDTIDARKLTISSVLEGGGNGDILYGGSARNLLIAGSGTATLYAGSAGDILIGGTTSYDNNLTALAYLMAEWDSTDSYTTRIKKLSGGGGLNGSYILNSTTVSDNSLSNYLYGGVGLDWFFAHMKGKNVDKVYNLTSGETITSI